MEYHKTKDPHHVKILLGHKSLRNTEVYINLEQATFSEGEYSEYTTRIARTVKGGRALLEVGFESSPTWKDSNSSVGESEHHHLVD